MKWFSKVKDEDKELNIIDMTPLQVVTHLCACIQLADGSIDHEEKVAWIDTISTNERLNQEGRLWIFTSVAGDKGRPSNYHYGASKSALVTHCEGLYNRCYRKPFKIRIIKPGFMATPMSYGKAPSILCISPKKVAKTLLKNPNKDGIEYLPFWWSVVMFIIQLLPRRIISRL